MAVSSQVLFLFLSIFHTVLVVLLLFAVVDIGAVIEIATFTGTVTVIVAFASALL